MSCKVEGCTRKLKTPNYQLCNTHYLRFRHTGSYELIKRPIYIVFDGSTYKYPTGGGGKQSGPCDIRDKFLNDRDLDLDKQVEELRESYKSKGIKKTNTRLALEISKNCDLAPNTIAKIINKIASLKPKEIIIIEEPTDFRTCAW